MSKRRIVLDQYGISPSAFEELHRLCLQYPDELKRQPRGRREMELIEQAAVRADPEAYQELIRAVTNDLTYSYCAYPRGVNQFGARRRSFYYYLALAKEITAK
jgi:hypothetical protein